MGNTRAIGTAYRDQDLDGSTIINSQFSGTQNPYGGTVWYCDSNGPGYDGKKWTTAFKTIGAAAAQAVSGDVIAVRGSFNEVVTLSQPGVIIVNGTSYWKGAQWTSAADTATLTLNAAGTGAQGIYFKPPAYSASTALGPCSILLSSAAYANIIGNRFQGQTGSYNAIYSPVANSDNVSIINNDFEYMNTATSGCAILGVAAGGQTYGAWKIVGNDFGSCLQGIILPARVANITGNTIGEYGVAPAGTITQLLTLGINLSGTSSGGNMVWGNQLGGTYSATLYKVGASGDQWGGNFNVISGGVTAANPA